jgi:hypothetical protein
MAKGTLTFSCPNCRIRLTVPVAMAGASGPCPSCRTTIVSPAAPAPEPGPTVVESPPVSAPQAAAPPVTKAPHIETRLPTEPVASDGPRLRPEPRQLPGRMAAPPISTRRSTEDQEMRPTPRASANVPRRAARMPNVLFPVLFSAMAAALVYLLLYFFLPSGPNQRLAEAKRPLPVPAKQEPAAVAPPVKVTPVRPPSAKPPPVLVVPAIPAPAATDPSVAKGDKVPPAVVANEVLEAFLRARDAAGRLDMVEPAVPVEELAATVLGAPLPEVAQIFSDLPQRYPTEQLTEFPFRVSFFIKGRPNVDYAVLVRQRGQQAPKVHLAAFLDLAGGRLAEFTATPNTKDPATFHVILEPVIGCHEERIPNPERKFTFKLLPSPFGKETARAYTSNGSRIRKLVEEPTYPIRWGIRGRATVTIQWNHVEDPAMPYLELLDINSPDWNP